MVDFVNKIICGDALSRLKEMPSGVVNCCISSPPYWALRDYGTASWEGGSLDCNHIMENKERGDGDRKSCQPRGKYLTRDICKRCGAKRIDKQLGLEKTFEEYIVKLCSIYDEVHRVLRDDGTCWVNLGDTYWGGKGQSGQGSKEYQEARQDVSINKPASHVAGPKITRPQDMNHDTVQAKSLCCIPDRFRIEMLNRGWILRNRIEWHKPNPMPSSAKDRFTVDFEDVMFFVKSNEALSWIRPDGVMVTKQPDYKSGEQGLDWEWGERNGKRVKLSLWKGYCYFFEPQYEPHKEPWRSTGQLESSGPKALEQIAKGVNQGFGLAGNIPREYNPLGRNKRTVWTIPNDGGLYIEDEKIIAEFTEWLKSRYPQQYAIWPIPTQSFAEAHFATFPEKLVEPMILSGCPKEVCSKCGQGRRKVYELGDMKAGRKQDAQYAKNALHKDLRSKRDKGWNTEDKFCPGMFYEKHFKGYTDCGCGAEYRPGLVMDPFMGSGTVGKVAAQNGRNWLGIELKEEYIEMAKRRIAEGETGITVAEQKAGQRGLFCG